MTIRDQNMRKRANLAHLALALVAASSLAACAGGDSGLPALDATGSIGNPVEGLSDQMSEMAKAAGVSKASNRARLDQLNATNRRCYSITARDEVWQAVKAEQESQKQGEASDLPPVADPWTPENKAYFEKNCTEAAAEARAQEMRSLHL